MSAIVNGRSILTRDKKSSPRKRSNTESYVLGFFRVCYTPINVRTCPNVPISYHRVWKRFFFVDGFCLVAQSCDLTLRHKRFDDERKDAPFADTQSS